MIDEIRMALNNNNYGFVFIVSLFLGLVFLNGKRKQILIPAALITIVVANPFTHELWYRFNDRAYWRLLWIIPAIEICPLLPASIIDGAKRIWVKLGVVAIAIATLVLCGFQVYTYKDSSFFEAKNAEKLPDEVVRVGEALLKIGEEPYTVSDPSLAIYLRQYSGKIKTFYARNVSWGVANNDIGRSVSENIYNDLKYVAQTMLNYDYEYLVTTNEGERESQLSNAGFEKIQQIDRYGIYRVHGKKTETRTYDELHRATSITTVSKEGEPINTNGYATVQFEHDTRGHVTGVSYYDQDGNRTYCEEKYSKLVSEYNGDKIIKKSFYDINDELIDVDSGYAVVEYEYNTFGKLLFDRYYDTNGVSVAEGKYYLHQYLNEFIGKDSVLFIAVNDDAAASLNSVLIDDLHRLGVKTDLAGKYRNSFYAIITPSQTIEEISSTSRVSNSGDIDGVHYTISSYGYVAGVDYCSIVIDGKEYAQNKRGLNIVVLTNGVVTDSVAFDTSSYETKVYR